MSRYRVMHDWHSLGGILLLSYSMFRTYSTPSKLEPETEVLNRIRAFLTSPGPSITVADEGHVLKNEKVGVEKTTCYPNDATIFMILTLSFSYRNRRSYRYRVKESRVRRE